MAEEITLAMFHNGFSVDECKYVRYKYLDTEINTVEMLLELEPNSLELKAMNATTKNERYCALGLLGSALMIKESLDEENKTGFIEIPTYICMKLFTNVAKQNSFVNLEDEIKAELKKRLMNNEDMGIRHEAIISGYARVYCIITKSEFSEIGLALLKLDIPTYSVYTILKSLTMGEEMAISRGIFIMICKLSVP